MRLPFYGVVLLSLCLHASSFAGSDSFQWWVTEGTVKVRPADRPPGLRPQAAEIQAARNEFEPFQIVMRSPEAAEVVSVQPSALTSAGGDVIPAASLQVYRVGYLTVRRPSRQPLSEGESIGEWPDALIPDVDEYSHEKRNAFPVQLRPTLNQSIWVDVYVPLDAAKGLYTGEVRVTMRGQPSFTVLVRLTVWDFALPSTSSLTTRFGFNGLSALKQSAGRYTSDDELRSVTFLYAKAALLHRISLHGATLTPPAFSENAVDWKLYDAEVGPFLDGTVLGDKDPLPGARATSVDLRTSGYADSDALKVQYWREWVKHFRERGWLDRLFYYVMDEPHPEDYPLVAARATLAHHADPAIRTLVTLQMTPSLMDAIDIWTPTINCFEDKPKQEPYCRETVPRKAYASEKPLWWYQACGTHGCFIEGGEYFRGWPSYMVDDDGVSNRIFQWMAWKYRIDGELYFNTDEAFAQEVDPWADLHQFGGNGDGTLFYPGNHGLIGGTTDVPVESIRLKLIREGLEDYEYLALMEQRGLHAAASRLVDRIVRNLYTFDHDPRTLSAARTEMAHQIEKEPGRERSVVSSRLR